MARVLLLALLVATCSARVFDSAGLVESSWDVYRDFYSSVGSTAPATVVKYFDSSSDSSVALAQLGQADFKVFERPVFSDVDVINIPLGGQAMVMAYNVPELAILGPTLVIDRAVLAAILVGNVTKWSDPAIRRLNPTLATSLPDRNITIGYVDRCHMSSCDVFKNSLMSFSPAFAAEFASRGRLFANMRFASEGRGQELSKSSLDRAVWLWAEPYSLSFLDHDDAIKAGNRVRIMAMYNKAGALVQASAESVQLAMHDFDDVHAAGNLTSDIHDPPGNGSWPLSYKLFVTTGKQDYQLRTNHANDRVGAILSSFCWAPSRSTIGTGFFRMPQLVPLDPALRKHVVATLATVWRGHLESVRPADNYVVGYGATLRSVATMTYKWRARGKYQHTTSSEGVDRLVDRSGDFAVSILGVESQRYEQMPDLAVMPLGAFSLVPVCHLNLHSGQLVLDLPTIASIYLGDITNWNDSRIRALNNDIVCAQLPDAKIRVVVDDVESDTNELLTRLLSSKVPAFATAVGVSRRPKFPVMASAVLSNAPFEVSGLLMGTQHSFAVWYGDGLDSHFPFGLPSVFVQHKVRHVAGIKLKGGTVVFPNTESIREALDESAGPSASWAEASMLDVSGPGSWPMTAVAKVLYRRSPIPGCIKPALRKFLRWVYTQPTFENDDMLLASSNAGLKRLVLDQITCGNDPTSTSTDAILVSTLSTLPLLLLLPLTCLLLAYMRRGEAQLVLAWEDCDNILLHHSLCEGRRQGNVHFGKWRDREVAVKIIKGNCLPVKTFRKEVNARAAILHPNIVPVLAACIKSPRELYVVMEYMELGSVYDFLHNERIGPIRFCVLLGMATDAARGMHYLHSSGLVHMGLTSHNLLLTASFQVKLSGIGMTGLKTFLRDSNQGYDEDRHQAWVAPELLDGQSPAISPAADVYAFGIILWELLSRMDPHGLTKQIRAGHLPLPDQAPRRYRALLQQCCHLQPSMRPECSEILPQLTIEFQRQ